MPFLSKLTLTHFRNFDFQSFEFKSSIIGITGNNGIGKTNLLDAIYYLCYTKSYFQNKEINNVQNGKEGFRLVGDWLMDNKGKESSICIWRDNKKNFEHDGISYSKITEHIGKFNAVIIAPDDIEIINGGSEIRRKFIDGLIAQNDQTYLQHLLKYQKVLQQKNAYLKQNQNNNIVFDLLDIYDEQLAESGAFLIQKRNEIATILPTWIAEFYDQLCAGKEVINVSYKSCSAPEQLCALIQKYRRKDLEYRRATFGPHTEDWLFSFKDYPFKTHASQGQKKSLLISLKLAQLKWLQSIGKLPVLLLDDIFEKLDHKRLQQLFALLQQFPIAQIFMTHTDSKDLSNLVKEYYSDLEIIQLT